MIPVYVHYIELFGQDISERNRKKMPFRLFPLSKKKRDGNITMFFHIF